MTSRKQLDEFRQILSNNDWWRKLGLNPQGGLLHMTENERYAVLVAEEYLRTLEPTRFVQQKTGGTTELTMDEVVEGLKSIQADVAAEIEQMQQNERDLGWSHIRAARAAADAEDILVDGEWEGFTRSDAIAWCWNLFQYEPHGFISPGNIVRHRALDELKAGSVPSVFGYARRARELKLSGATPESYRMAKEAIGARLFDPGDVSSGPTR